MSTLTISLPDNVHAFIEEQVANGAYPTASDYLAALVSEDHERRGDQKPTLLPAREGSGVRPAATDSMTPQELADWRARFDVLVDAFRAGFAASGLSAEALEKEIRTAREEVRAERRVRRAREQGPGARGG